MTDPRRSALAVSPVPQAAERHIEDATDTFDVPLVDFVALGGLRGLTPYEMFPGCAA